MKEPFDPEGPFPFLDEFTYQVDPAVFLLHGVPTIPDLAVHSPKNRVETIGHLTHVLNDLEVIYDHCVEGARDEGKDGRMAGHGGPAISFTFAKYGKKVYISCFLN